MSPNTSLKFSWKIHKAPTKIYEGAYSLGSFYVSVNSEKLSPGPSLALINHSPSGFAWGYNGSGPAQLALAILLDYTGDSTFARRYHQRFREEIISHLPQNVSWMMDDTDIDRWLSENTITKETWLIRKTLRPKEITQILESVGLSPIAFYMGKHQRRILAGYNVDNEWLEIPDDKIEALRTKFQEIAPESRVEFLKANEYTPDDIQHKDSKVVVIHTPVYRDLVKIPWREIKKRIIGMGYSTEVKTKRNDVYITVWIPVHGESDVVINNKVQDVLEVLKGFDSRIEVAYKETVNFRGSDLRVVFNLSGEGIQNTSNNKRA